MTQYFLPAFSLADAGIVNIDFLTQRHLQQHPTTPPESFLDPSCIQHLLDEFHRQTNITWSYGGYLENRSTMLAASYLQKSGNFIHLGIDVNVPGGTIVQSTYDATVLLVDDDKDASGGWGPRVILQPTSGPYIDRVVVYGHLEAVAVVTGDTVSPGDALGAIGSPPNNGNWFPHLHIQTVHQSYIDTHQQWQRELDGYGHPNMRDSLQQWFPDPSWLLT
jgi:murein DD-endopeptidase MepM/ murein hydrolase activator NlpD